jgi:A/G-specific adenine glycosylase
VGALAKRLLAWYEDHRRDLPWRRTRDPYRIWVAEVMLQQTRVETAIPYYHRFLECFPTVEHLARASLDEVLKVWEGLGYYARARNLHAAAQIVVASHGGELPHTWEELLALPGIGPYTAGAILSVAFGQEVPALDGNARRVLCRLFNVDQDPRRPAAQRRLWTLAHELLPPSQAGAFNQALMDLGTLICTPRNPSCGTCPLTDLCQARQLKRQGELPVRAPRRAIPHRDVTAGVIWKGDRLLIAQRLPQGLLGGLWEFPGGKQEAGESLPHCLQREIREELGIEIEVGELFLTLQHAYSHFRITLHVFRCRYKGGQPQALDCADWRWVPVDELPRFAFPVADQKIVAALLSAGTPSPRGRQDTD